MLDKLFEKCSITDLPFTEEYEKCTFKDGGLAGSDLSTSVNILLDPENNRLKGAKFAPASLTGLLYKYHIDTI